MEKPKGRWKDDVCSTCSPDTELEGDSMGEKFGVRRSRKPRPENGPKCYGKNVIFPHLTAT